MLDAIGVGSIDDLFGDVPQTLQLDSPPDIPAALSELDLRRHMEQLASRNRNLEERPCFRGGGIYDHFIPVVVNEVVNFGSFKTSYTPYQPEMSQGMLQAIYEFQSMICALTGMDIANASMYEAGTSLAEAVLLACKRTKRNRVLVSGGVHPEYIEVLRTYTQFQEITLEVLGHQGGLLEQAELEEKLGEDLACLVVQNPNFFGLIEDVSGRVAEQVHGAGAKFVVCCDPISLGILKPPGDYGADIVVGEGQALGNSPSLGGPTFGFFAIKHFGLERRERLLRFLPGRLSGSTIDSKGREAFTLAMTSREQHVKREKASSNICTNHNLNAIAATVYLTLMGSAGLREVARLCLQKAHFAFDRLKDIPGVESLFPDKAFFKEFAVKLPKEIGQVNAGLSKAGIIGGLDLSRFYPEYPNTMLIAATEKRTREQIDQFAATIATLCNGGP